MERIEVESNSSAKEKEDQEKPYSILRGDEIAFQFDDGLRDKDVTVYNSLGQIAHKVEVAGLETSFRLPSKGIYLLVIVCDGEAFVEKLSK